MRGELWPGDNPRLVLNPAWHAFLELWNDCRDESGIRHWPEEDGVLGSQPAWMVDAFNFLSALDAAWRAEDMKAGGA